MAKLAIADQVLNGLKQAVAISQTNQVVSNVFEIGPADATALCFEVTAASVSGTGAVVKLQKSFDGTNFVDVDSTNAKVTISGNGRFPLALNSQTTAGMVFMPLPKFLRFVCTTGGSDAVTVTKILVQLQA
jgi:hypothetical protein